MALVANSSNGKFVAPIFLAFLILIIQSASCQVSEEDGQFEAYHQDIGRISGIQSGSQVAPQTTLINKKQHQQAARHQQQAAAPAVASAARKPNRITLVPRRDQYTPIASDNAIATTVQQQPPPPQRQLLQAQPLPTQLQAPTAQAALIPAQLPAPTFESIAPATIQPQQPQSYNQAVQQPTATTLVNGPALASFRATGSTISARHSALMAQVAAERAAVGALEQPPPVATLGSPVEALSSPVAAQVHPPAALQQSHHQHRSQQLQQLQQHAAAATAPNFQQNHHHHQSQLQQQQPSLAQPQASPTGISSAFVLDSAQDVQVPAPSFEQVLSSGCPPKGVFSYENKDFCDRYYMCTNGTFTEEACPNGLSYSQQGAVYQHCAYNWNVDCGRKKGAEPISSPGCPWQFGIFPIASNGQCSIDYYACEWGVPETKRCTPEGLFYDDRIKGCQWADQLGCKSEALLNFKCPAEDEENPYWPYPRYYHTQRDVIVCVNEQPRLVHCNEDQLVEPSSLACIDVKKKKKQQQQQF